MRRGLLALVAVLAVVSTASVAAAQEGIPNGSDGGGVDVEIGGDDNETETVVATIDNSTRVVDYTYKDGTFTFTIESDNGAVLTLLSLERSDQSGAGQANIKRVILSPGTNTVEFRAPQDDPAVFFSTPESIENGRVAFIQERTGIDLFTGPARWGFVWIAGGLGLFGGAGTVLWYAREFIREDDPEIVERVL